MLKQPSAELAKHSVVEPGAGQVQGQQVLPVDPRSDGLGGLAITQALTELHECDEREAPRRVRRLAALRIEISKAGVVEHRSKPVAQEEVGIAARERGSGDTGRVVGHAWD